jgi:hypothetical protein
MSSRNLNSKGGLSYSIRSSETKKRKIDSQDFTSSHIHVMPSPEKKEIDVLLSKFFFGCNLPFSTIKSPYFRSFVNALNPNYNVPCPDTLSTTLLDQLFDQLNVKSEKEKYATMLIDGWTNSVSHRKFVVVMAKPRDGEEGLLIDSYDFTDTSSNAINITSAIHQSRIKAKEERNLVIDSVASDNEPSMRKATKDSNLVNFGCMSHIADLMINDIHDKNLASQVRKVLVCFRKPKLQERVAKLGGSAVILRGETR